MVPRPDPYRIDEADPRAPSQEAWDRMTPAERARVLAMLPNEVPVELQPPEGDPHFKAKVSAASTLSDFFRRAGRKVYVSSELGVYYPDEPRFSPDILAVLDVEPHDRTTWVVSAEGKGLDFVLEVYFGGSKKKDYTTNVERYARLGIGEYFIFDRLELGLRGYRLPAAERAPVAKGRAYRPILPQGGGYASEVLGLELMLDGPRLRFLHGKAPLPEADELIAKLGSLVDDLLERQEEARLRADAEAERAAQLEARLAEETARRTEEAALRAEAERSLAEARAEIERLKRGG